MAVDEYRSRLYFFGKPPGAFSIGGINAGSEPERGIIGKADGMFFVFGAQNQSGRPEYFFSPDAAGRIYPVQNRRGVEPSLPLWNFAAGQAYRAV